MLLSDHDLKQFDEAAIDALAVEPLRVLTVKLLTDLKETRDRRSQDPSNSSRPPSSQPPWMSSGGSDSPTPEDDEDTDRETDLAPEPPAHSDESAQADETDEQKRGLKKPPGKPGKPKGAPGYGRQVDLPVNREKIHRPDQCQCCGERFPADAPSRAYTGHYELDLIAPASGSPGLEVDHIKHLYQERQCACGHWTRAEPGRCEQEDAWQVELTEWHLAGPRLVALICALSLRLRASRRGIQEFLEEWLGVTLGIACINQCLHEAGRAVDPVVERDILPAIREAELLHVDETGWKEKGTLLWLWVFTCTTATLFCIDRRSRKILQKILTKDFVGWLMSDGFWAYRDYDQRLRCLAHLIRKARGLEQSLNRQAHRFGTQTLELIEHLLNQVYQAREGPDPPAQVLYSQNRAVLDAFSNLCVDHWDSAHEKTRELAREFTNDWEAIWAILDYPLLPITNNAAEQALRHWVITRRITFGTRTPQGSQAFPLLASVIETCRKRNVCPWPYLADVVRLRRKGEPAPILPEPASAD
jgi:hypothetical protein